MVNIYKFVLDELTFSDTKLGISSLAFIQG